MTSQLSGKLSHVPTDTNPWIGPEGLAGLVSIVVPTFNRAPLLKETLESLIRQSYRPLEIIVVGDGTEDNTADIVAEAKRDASEGVEIKYITQERSGGPAARNLGARNSSGEFLVFMDDDDIAAKDFISERVEALRDSEANIAFGAWQSFVVDKRGLYRLLEMKGRQFQEGAPAWHSFLGNWDLLLQGCVLRRSLVSKVGPWQLGLHKSQDLDYKARLAADECCRHVYCERGLIFYRLHEASISGGLDAAKLESYVEVLERIEALGVNRSDYEQTKKKLANYFWFHAFWLYGEGAFARGYEVLQQAKKHFPGICRRKGLIPTLLDLVGLDVAIGPTYFFLSQTKKTLGLSKRKYLETKESLASAGD